MAIFGEDDRESVSGPLTDPPYSGISQVVSRFPDGTVVQGSGVLVGPNDVLTAAHVVYSEEYGGWANAVQVTPGRNGQTKPFGTVAGSEVSAPQEWTAGRSFGSDYGLIGLDRPMGYRTGWLDWSTECADGACADERVTSLGYPGDQGGTTLFSTSGTIDRQSQGVLYFDDDLDAKPGQSGSPIFLNSANALESVVGLVSHQLIQPDENGVLALTSEITDDLASWAGNNDEDLTPFRVNPEYSAGDVKAISQLYLGLLERKPDQQGLHYWLDELAQGASIVGVAAAILNSDESRDSARFLGQSDHDFLENLYTVVLGRTPDPEGLAYWKGELEAGRSKAEIAVGFTSSEEFSQQQAITTYGIWHDWFESFVRESVGTGEAEVLPGSPGDDYLSGGGGADQLKGGQGSDYLDGGAGDDLLYGGPGSDFFALDAGSQGHDVIADFDVTTDFLRLRSADLDLVPAPAADGEGLVLSAGEGLSVTLLGMDVNSADSLMVV